MSLLKIAWIIGIMISLAFLTGQINLHIASPVVVQSDNLQNVNVDQLVKENVKSATEESGKFDWSRILPPILILGGLLLYTRKKKSTS